MRDKLYYINHLNERVDFGKADILINENDARNYEWDVQSLYNRIIGFSRGIEKVKLPLIIYGENRKSTLSRILDVAEKDIIDNVPGRLYCGGCYKKGYIVQSSVKSYTNDSSVDKTLTFVSDNPYWIYETFYSHSDEEEQIGGGKGYPYDYAYDYRSSMNSGYVTIENYNGAQIKLLIFGYANNPTIVIGGQEYTINCEVLPNEYIEINTQDKTIVLVKSNGQRVNMFANRQPSINFFRKIPKGTSAIQSAETLKFVIYLLQERSEPLWS